MKPRSEMKRALQTGDKVGAERWPYAHAHPDAWGKPWSGTLLAVNDPRAWAGTIAFGFEGKPTQPEVDAHIARCIALGSKFEDSVPVLWNFDEPRIYWERRARLRSYADDLRAWFKERSTARAARRAA